METVPRAYTEALEGAGALPVLLPNADDPALAETYLDLIDGLLLSGGDDPHPRHFGEEPHPNLEMVDERRDLFEIALARGARRRGLPVFGICRGIQLLNIAAGGDIYQDLVTQSDSQIRHVQRTVADGPWHEVEITPGSRLAEITGEERLAVNSFHHQACRRPGAGLQVVARSGDGLIEALEEPNTPFCLGVQWHPELAQNEPRSASRALFAAFANAASAVASEASKKRRRVPAGTTGAGSPSGDTP